MKLIFGVLTILVMMQVSQASDYAPIYGNSSACFDNPTADICIDRGSDQGPNTQVCRARDENQVQFSYTMSLDFPITLAKRRALEKCQAKSAAPETCHVTFCYKY